MLEHGWLLDHRDPDGFSYLIGLGWQCPREFLDHPRDLEWELSLLRRLWRNPPRSSLAASNSIRGRFNFMGMDCWCFLMSSFNQGNAGSPEWRFRTLSSSDERASVEVSISECKADKLLVRSLPRINCNLANSVMSVQTIVCSNSLTPPMLCMVLRRMAWMCSRMLSAVSKALSPWCVVSVGDTALLPPITT